MFIYFSIICFNHNICPLVSLTHLFGNVLETFWNSSTLYIPCDLFTLFNFHINMI